MQLLTKQQVLKTLEQFPDTFTPDELIERILLIYELQEAIQQSDNNEGQDIDQVFDQLLNDDEAQN